ncbi:MAG: hypothetical protein IPL22_00110 [Bacteroidetes bacterium]|nr:hypothetical protein [Bacteroidota bacterium]
MENCCKTVFLTWILQASIGYVRVLQVLMLMLLYIFIYRKDIPTPFDNITLLQYDPKDLFIESTTDPIGNVTRIENFNYRVLAPSG